MISFLALVHMLKVFGVEEDDSIPCTCTHVECYATGPYLISPKQPD